MSVDVHTRELAEQLHRDLEDESVRTSTLLRRAARLASVCRDHEHRLLFELHIDGFDSSGKQDPRVEKWPENTPPPKWNLIKAFLQDRADGQGTQSLPVSDIELLLDKLTLEAEIPEYLTNPRARLALLETEVPLKRILNRVRSRIGNFVRTVEANLAREPQMDSKTVSKSMIFIGHGGSWIWRDLRDLIANRLQLPWDEFNREASAGKSTKERLEEMLNQAAFAFLVMTAEDEHADGKRHARENVIHEIGLFQGKLGFTKAIILLEEGCEEFSNIHGLTQIRFPKGDILARSEEIRRVLEREGFLGQT